MNTSSEPIYCRENSMDKLDLHLEPWYFEDTYWSII